MGYWNSRGLRGSAFEEVINFTNEMYRRNGLAVIQKIPTPITPVQLDKDKRITLAYFDKQSTVDYMGVAQGIAICFDAKECAVDTFSLQNIHEHQVDFMVNFEKQGGVAFLILYYSHKDLFYYLNLKQLLIFWNRAKDGGRKSFRFDELETKYIMPKKHGVFVPYLDMINIDLEEREE